MEKQYTTQDIQHFFEQFRKVPECYELEKVHQLINTPSAMARWRGSKNFNLLKFIIMTTVLVTSVTCLFLWMAPYKHGANIMATSASSASKSLEKEVPKPFTNQSLFIVKRNDQKSEKINANKPTLQAEPSMFDEVPVKLETEMKCNKINNVSDCVWPKDSMVDKHKLFVYLTNEELLKLGVTLYKDSMYYYNRTPDGEKNISSLYNTRANKDKYTTFDFYLQYDSDTACTKFRWGHIFYHKIDTLVPIVIHIADEEKILWFTPHESLFSALPARYAFLKDLYANLKCVKRKEPKRQLVNYWNAKRNVVLDKINYLILSKEEMRKIGIGIFNDSISMVDPTSSFKYLEGKRGLLCGTFSYNGSVAPEIPDMFPVLITDIKGLKQNGFGSWEKKQQSAASGKEIFNTLIPVQLPFSEIFSNKKYSLVLWYYPSDNFLRALPDRYRDEIRQEIGFIASGQKSGTSSCTYFEACKSTLHLNDFKVYPNPVFTTATVEFNIPEEANGKISLVNISGNELKLLVSQTKFPQGFQSYQVNLSDVNPGIYLISIMTDKGFKTQRIVVSR